MCFSVSSISDTLLLKYLMFRGGDSLIGSLLFFRVVVKGRW